MKNERAQHGDKVPCDKRGVQRVGQQERQTSYKAGIDYQSQKHPPAVVLPLLALPRSQTLIVVQRVLQGLDSRYICLAQTQLAPPAVSR